MNDIHNIDVSIVIPVYNVEAYLSRCIKSLQAQTASNFEIIFINDGSTDGSLNLLQDFMKTSNRSVQVKSIPNSGVSIARNTGIAMASGTYISFVDADDMLHPNYIGYMYEALNAVNGCPLAICEKMTISDSCGEVESCRLDLSYTVENHLSVLNAMLYHQLSVGIWCAMIETKFLKFHQLLFAEHYKYSEDLELLWRFVIRSETVIRISNSLYYYRNRPKSAMNKFSPNRSDGYTLFQNLEQYIEHHCKLFYHDFKRFGVSYWVWSTLWQAAKLSTGYSQFVQNISFMDVRSHLKTILGYPSPAVRSSALLFIISPRLYYILIHYFYKKRGE